MKHGQPRSARASGRRLVVIILAIALGITAAIAWILSIGQVIPGIWSYVFPVCFTILTALFALLQWLFPFSPEKSKSLPSSNVLLVDAALDTNDSPYEQVVEDGRTVIRYKGLKPGKQAKKINE